MDDQTFDLETASPLCSLCRQKFSLLKSITDYGIFFLVGIEEGIYGTSCGICKKTVVFGKSRSNLEWLKGELGRLKAQGCTRPGVVYDPFPYISYYLDEVNPYLGIYYTFIRGREESLEDHQIGDLHENVPTSESEGFYDTYFFGDPTMGPAIGIGSPNKDDIHTMLEIENSQGTKVFPRYAPYRKSIEDIHNFCWTHRLLLYHARDTGMSEGLLWSLQNQSGKVDKLVDFFVLLAPEDSPTFHNKRNEKSLKALWKYSGTDETRKPLSDLADQFIDEYIKLHQKVGVSYEDLAGLKYRYVEKIGDLATRESITVKVPEEGEVRTARSKKVSQAEFIIDFAMKKGELFKTSIGEMYIRVGADDHDTILEVGGDNDSDAIKWIRRTFLQETGNLVKAQDIKEAIATLESLECPDREVFIRVAGNEDVVYLDLANDKWEQVEITKKGWSIVSNKKSPFAFRRSKGMHPLPYPAERGSLYELRDLLNIQQEDGAFVLIVAWLIGAMHPNGPYPILLLQGEQGTAKSMTARMLRELVDPGGVPLRDLPTSARDLAIAANSNWVLGFDNLSGLKTKMSDAFCRLSTGGGFATRGLFKNKGEVLFKAKRPLLLNGIADIASRQDLAERSLIVRLPPIPSSMRKAESKLLRKWGEAKSRVFGCLCSAVSEALRNLEGVKMEDPGRMADFSYWVTAAEPALPWQEGRFEREYKLNRQSLIESAIETDPVATAILTLMESQNEWTGKLAELLDVLSSAAPKAVRKSSDFPKTSIALSKKMNEVAGFLRTVGIEIERSKSGDKKISIRKVTFHAYFRPPFGR